MMMHDHVCDVQILTVRARVLVGILAFYLFCIDICITISYNKRVGKTSIQKGRGL